MTMKNLAAFASGILFAVGLAVSGMTMPSKVIGFLDLFGQWDASLAFVMAGAIGVHLVGYRLVRKRAAPLFGESFDVPSKTTIDRRLVGGAALFGVGWGLGGFCPGPSLVAASSGMLPAIVFVGTMIVGVVLVANRT